MRVVCSLVSKKTLEGSTIRKFHLRLSFIFNKKNIVTDLILISVGPGEIEKDCWGLWKNAAFESFAIFAKMFQRRNLIERETCRLGGEWIEKCSKLVFPEWIFILGISHILSQFERCSSGRVNLRSFQCLLLFFNQNSSHLSSSFFSVFSF